ncbi:heterokaryon incompatibility protein-domain-containing protein [Cercophora scortea]|uniref:Heterokaryon incompatibility protein-domain-containing protein n=1 Tax=Cercophora scortea TaxID=314031 RepID=A0AAE0INJ5_9PEZI|nr:heterokaryon incompatibility protein-domain-containing protein [Cercophora scortea]
MMDDPFMVDRATAALSNLKLRPRNPLLCQRCQSWNNIETVVQHGSTLANIRSLEQLAYNAHCLLCRALVSAVETRRSASQPELTNTSSSSWPAAQILVRNHGPFFLDNGIHHHHPTAHTSARIDNSEVIQTTVRLLISLEISFVPEVSMRDWVDGAAVTTLAASHICITPQFALRFSGVQGSPGPPQLISIEPWEVPFFDISLLRTWLRGCEEVHHRECIDDELRKATQLMRSSWPRDFRVIDVHEMKLIRPPGLVRFVALSYMWQQQQEDGGNSPGADHVQLEKHNATQLESAGGLVDIALPDIISDAIALCRDLGESYLWVDRLCIIQDDAVSKHDQIHHMDRIYQSAIFTIVGALNSRDGGGLPGYSGRPRKASVWSPPRSVDLDSAGRGIKQNSMEALVYPSLWNKRGWTFQERILARRCLFITEFLVIFECSQGQASEEMTYTTQQQPPEPPPRSPDEHHDASPESEQDEHRMRQQEHRQIPGFRAYVKRNTRSKTASYYLIFYFHRVEDYTSRQFSYDRDILEAFAGVGNVLSHSLSSSMLFGLPEKHLPQALMWTCRGAVRRRENMPQIPSWSWASSLSRADYFWIQAWMQGGSTAREHIIQITSLVYFYFQDPELCALRKLDVQERWMGKEMAIDAFRDLDEIPNVLTKKMKYYKPGVERTTRTWKECPHNPWQTLAHTALDPDACRVAASIPGCLVFNTTVASDLILKRDHRHQPENQSEQDVVICTRKGAVVGWMNRMSTEWIATHVDDDDENAPPRRHEFIVLCGALANWKTRKAFVADPAAKNYDLWRLHVLLVERVFPSSQSSSSSSSGAHVVRRVEVGIVKTQRWKECSPRWETVVLC